MVVCPVESYCLSPKSRFELFKQLAGKLYPLNAAPSAAEASRRPAVGGVVHSDSSVTPLVWTIRCMGLPYDFTPLL